MNLRVTKANTFTLEPGKKYAVLITDNGQISPEQKAGLKEELGKVGMTVVFLPQGARYKVVEASEEAK